MALKETPSKRSWSSSHIPRSFKDPCFGPDAHVAVLIIIDGRNDNGHLPNRGLCEPLTYVSIAQGRTIDQGQAAIKRGLSVNVNTAKPH
jgi:hypothetical protein